MFSPTYISAVVAVVVNILSLLGINVGTDALTTTATTIVTIVAGLVILFRRWSKGDVSMVGRVSK